MTMTNAEIVADYRQAAKPLKQIGILADLNGSTRQEIVEILREAGCELPKRYQEITEAGPAEREAEKRTPEITAAPAAWSEPEPIMGVLELLRRTAERLAGCEREALRIRSTITGERAKPIPMPEPSSLLDLCCQLRGLAGDVLDNLAQIRAALGEETE